MSKIVTGLQSNPVTAHEINNNNQMICLTINMKETGRRLRELVRKKGYSVLDIMDLTGISTEQAVYKWFGGKSLPSLETLVVLSRVLEMDVSDLLVIDEYPDQEN